MSDTHTHTHTYMDKCLCLTAVCLLWQSFKSSQSTDVLWAIFKSDSQEFRWNSLMTINEQLAGNNNRKINQRGKHKSKQIKRKRKRKNRNNKWNKQIEIQHEHIHTLIYTHILFFIHKNRVILESWHTNNWMCEFDKQNCSIEVTDAHTHEHGCNANECSVGRVSARIAVISGFCCYSCRCCFWYFYGSSHLLCHKWAHE